RRAAHGPALGRDRSRVGLRERGDALRGDPVARAERKPLLALGTALRRAGTPRGRLRCARRDLLARRDARPRERGRANIGLTAFVTRVLNGRGRAVNFMTIRCPEGGAMSVFGKSVTAVVAGVALVVAVGLGAASAQAPSGAPPEARTARPRA